MQSALIKTEGPRFSGLTLGKVFCVYPEANMVDILLFDGSVLKDVQVIGQSLSSSVGCLNLPLPKYNKNMLERNFPLGIADHNESDVVVVVGFIGGSILRPIVLGFLFPEENEILCARTDGSSPDTTTKGNETGGMFLWKHCSNVYTRVGEDGELEISHPTGLLIKIGPFDSDKNPDFFDNSFVNEQRTVINNYDKNLRPFKYLDPETDEVKSATDMYIYHPSGTRIKIGPDGTVELYVQKDVIKTVKGNLTETIEGDVNRTVKGNVTEIFEKNFDLTVNEDLNERVKGDADLTYDGDLDSSVVGDETNSVGGDWSRSASGTISDTASTINHN